MNIGFDLDGVITDLASYQLKYGNLYFSKRQKPIVNAHAYDIQEIFDCTYKERQQFWTRYIWYYCLFYPPRRFAKEIIGYLQEDGHKIYLITSRVYTEYQSMLGSIFRAMVRIWLKWYGFKFEKIVFCSEKHSARDKKIACEKYNIDLMIDDKMENIDVLREVTKTICFDVTYNSDYQNDGVLRAFSFLHIYELISTGLSQGKDKARISD